MNKFKSPAFSVKFFAFILFPSIILVYNAVNSGIYNFSFSSEEIKGIVSATYIHPYISAFVGILGAIVSVALMFTSAFFEKTHKSRKNLFIFVAVFSFFAFLQNTIVWYIEIHNYFNRAEANTLMYIIFSFSIIGLILISSFLRCFLATKQVFFNKISDNFILFVAIFAALIPFLNVLVSIINILEYDIPLINNYISYEKIIDYSLKAYSSFCVIYFGFRNKFFTEGAKTIE